MNPVTPTSAMSRGGTFMRPGAMAWGHEARGDPAARDPATPAAIEDTAQVEVLGAIERAVQHGPGPEFPIDVTFPGEGEPDQVDAWITAHAEPFYIRA